MEAWRLMDRCDALLIPSFREPPDEAARTERHALLLRLTELGYSGYRCGDGRETVVDEEAGLWNMWTTPDRSAPAQTVMQGREPTPEYSPSALGAVQRQSQG